MRSKSQDRAGVIAQNMAGQGGRDSTRIDSTFHRGHKAGATNRSRSGNDRESFANATMPYRHHNNFLIGASATKREGSYEPPRNSTSHASPMYDRKHSTQEFGHQRLNQSPGDRYQADRNILQHELEEKNKMVEAKNREILSLRRDIEQLRTDMVANTELQTGTQ